MLGEPLGQGQNAFGSRQTRRIGHGVRSLDHLNALSQTMWPRRRVAIPRDDQATQRRIGRPKRLDCLRHRAARLACAEH